MVIDFTTYPFMKNVNEELKKYAGGVKLQDLLVSQGNILNSAIERIKSVVLNKEKESFKKYGSNSVFVFYTIILILSASNDRSIIKKYINNESKIFYETISKEHEENLVEIAKGLGVNVLIKDVKYHERQNKRLTETRTSYCIKFTDYLQIHREDDEYLILSKQILKDGYVCLTREKLLLLMKYIFKNKLNTMIKPLTLSQIPDKLKEILGLSFSKRTPPCMENIKTKLDSNQQLSDNEIIAYATYLRDIGYSLDSIKAFLAKVNFTNTESLLELLKKKRVIEFSCEVMKKLNLCVNDCGVKNPLQLYYQR